ncbi:MAG TPA: TetR/AcrR family transcriptional regulator, partial [Agitococcus sp.]|nr:TetR/AcrR family transcriptional regulator [Agitococcus sp.]
LVTALFFMALDDQSQLRQHYLASAKTAQEGVAALIYSYVDWVTDEPELARFQLRARMIVATGSKAEALNIRNKERNLLLYNWMRSALLNQGLEKISSELMPSLIIGQAEHFCRTWLSGRTQNTPRHFREPLAQAAWASMQIYMQENI